MIIFRQLSKHERISACFFQIRNKNCSLSLADFIVLYLKFWNCPLKKTFYVEQCNHVWNTILPFLSTQTITSFLSEPVFQAWLPYYRTAKKCPLANTAATFSWIACVIERKYSWTLQVSSFPEWEKRNRNKLLPGTVLFQHSGNLN